MGERIQNSVQLTFTQLMLDWLQLRIPKWHFGNTAPSIRTPDGVRTLFSPFNSWDGTEQSPKVGYGVIVDEDRPFVLFNHPPAIEDEDKMFHDLRKIYATSPTFFEEVQTSIDIIEMRVRAKCFCGVGIPGIQPPWGE